MPIDILAHDTRLAGRTPATTSGRISFEVGESTPIADFFARVLGLADQHGGIGRLFLMCHGVRVLREDTTALQFCRELISYRNVHLFQSLSGRVDRIILFACHAAEISMTRGGDGDELCRRMARNAQVELTAAREDQTYYREEHCRLFFCEETAIDYGDWEGEVVVYGRDGNVIATFSNPSPWYDERGTIHDPRLEPRPGVWYDSSGTRHAGR